jgi:hypothetical protein
LASGFEDLHADPEEFRKISGDRRILVKLGWIAFPRSSK